MALFQRGTPKAVFSSASLGGCFTFISNFYGLDFSYVATYKKLTNVPIVVGVVLLKIKK
jgi:hypothetical protein